MIRISFYTLFLLLLSNSFFCQSPFWSENFGAGCTQGNMLGTHTPSNGSWSISNPGLNGNQANNWFVSGSENGQPTGNCGGNSCITTPGLTNKSLHISTYLNPYFDSGAIYIRSFNSNTHKRAQSPNIDCSMRGNIVLTFNYMLGGELPYDKATVEWKDNTGNWNVLGDLVSTIGSCTTSATWSIVTYTLPDAANGTSSLQVGFRWQNIASVGDPTVSVAIDDVVLSGVNISGLHDLHNDLTKLNLFPNPVTDKLLLEFDSESWKTIAISNTLSQIVYVLDNPKQKQDIDLSLLPQGAYFLIVQSENSRRIFKLLKE